MLWGAPDKGLDCLILLFQLDTQSVSTILSSAAVGGDGVEQLEVELESGAHRHTGVGDVSLVVRTEKPL